MMLTLDEILRRVDPIEAKQRATGKNINDFSAELPTSDANQILMPRAFFGDAQDIIVRKHHRFSPMPKHTHDFVELNYVYSGTCTQYIDGKPIVLPAGSLIMLDKKITQSIDYMGEGDILVNILLRDGTSLNSILSTISNSQNIVTKFMYNASRLESVHDNFIVFDLKQDEYANKLLDCIMLRGLIDDGVSNAALRSLYALLVPELPNCIKTETINFNSADEDDILPILRYIDKHYKTTTLAELAEHFGYNPNYLGNKLRETTGSSFKAIVDNKKFSVAAALLKETKYSAERIAAYVGYNSTTSLYHLFKRVSGTTPHAYRK